MSLTPLSYIDVTVSFVCSTANPRTHRPRKLQISLPQNILWKWKGHRLTDEWMMTLSYCLNDLVVCRVFSIYARHHQMAVCGPIRICEIRWFSWSSPGCRHWGLLFQLIRQQHYQFSQTNHLFTLRRQHTRAERKRQWWQNDLLQKCGWWGKTVVLKMNKGKK